MNSLMEMMFLINNMPKINSAKELIFGLIIFILFNILSKIDFLYYLNEIYYYFYDIFFRKNVIIISDKSINETSRGQSDYKYCPISYKSIMYYLSKSNDKTITRLVQHNTFNCDWESSKITENVMPIYKVSQYNKFVIDKNINGRVYSEVKTMNNTVTNSNYEDEVNFIEISSKLSLTHLQSWIDKRTFEYKQLIKDKSCETQSLIEISYNYKNNELNIDKTPWESNCNFNNRFFTDKDNIVKSINNFLNNKELYIARGIPHTLGFLLWGEPGCGKTGFIKALMNKTGKHGISIKLNNKFNLSKLKNILFNENISEELCIPLNNRIIIFEDIDCMSEIVTTRFDDNDMVCDSNDSNDSNDDSNNTLLQLLKNNCKEKTDDHLLNNNLSYLLNILDGLEEYPDRIIIMTSNQPEKLDKALIRPGRIDHIIEFTNATLEDIKNIIKHYWSCEKKLNNNQLTHLEKFINNNKHFNKKYSHAVIVNVCRKSLTFEQTLINLRSL